MKIRIRLITHPIQDAIITIKGKDIQNLDQLPKDFFTRTPTGAYPKAGNKEYKEWHFSTLTTPSQAIKKAKGPNNAITYNHLDIELYRGFIITTQGREYVYIEDPRIEGRFDDEAEAINAINQYWDLNHGYYQDQP